jgi:prophage tail gpP-like protein
MFSKAIVLIPEVKRARIKKAINKKGSVAFVTTTGKKIVVPEESILTQDEKAIVYKLPKRRMIKGDFVVKGNFLVDEDTGTRVSLSILATGETPAKKKKKKEEKKKPKKKKKTAKDKKKKKKKKK